MADLNAATLDDVKTWFKSWYGPNNAVLVLAGDIDAKTAKEKAQRYFGDIPASATLKDLPTSVPKRAQDTRETIPDRVPQVRIYRAWPVAEYGSRDGNLLQLLSQVLGGSASSRLDARLVHVDKLADNVSAFQWTSEISGTFFLTADVKQGVDPAKVEGILDEELQRLLREGPTAAELEQAKTAIRADFVRGIERIGGFGGKSDVLAECAVYAGKPDCYRDDLEVIATATPAQVQAAGRKWLGKGSHTIIVQPSETPASALPESASAAPATTPAAIPRAGPEVQDGEERRRPQPGRAADPALPRPEVADDPHRDAVQRHAGVPGRAPRSAGRADEPGVPGRLQRRHRQEARHRQLHHVDARRRRRPVRRAAACGAQGSAGCRDRRERRPRQRHRVAVGAEGQAGAVAGPVRRRGAPSDASTTTSSSACARSGSPASSRRRSRPQTAAMRVMPPLLYGSGHAYAIPFTGSGTTESIKSLTRDDLVAFHRNWLQPEQARIVVAGDTTLKEIVPQLEARFGDWKNAPDAPQLPAVTTAARPQATRVFLINQPGAIQSNIYVGQLIPPTGDAGTIDFDFANGVLGGEFSSRLNMNLREDKHWAYGSYSGAGNAKGQRPWMASAAVQSDKTIESIGELKREINAFVSGERAVTEAEVAKIRASNTLSLPGGYETASSLLGQVASNLRYGRPQDYVLQYKARNEAMTPALTQTAAKTLDPKVLTWVVVGDLAKIESGIRALNLGEVQVVDADGKPVAAAPAK